MFHSSGGCLQCSSYHSLPVILCMSQSFSMCSFLAAKMKKNLCMSVQELFCVEIKVLRSCNTTVYNNQMEKVLHLKVVLVVKVENVCMEIYIMYQKFS